MSRGISEQSTGTEDFSATGLPDRDTYEVDTGVEGARQGMLGALLDIPNCLTLAGLTCGFLAVPAAISGHPDLAMVCLLWATLFDWYDGAVARLLLNRAAELGRIGAALDSLADLLTCSVAPAVVLVLISDASVSAVAVAVLLVLAGAVRLAHFQTFGLGKNGHYLGVPVPVNVIVVTALFAVRGSISTQAFDDLFLATMLALAVLNVSPIPFPKPRGWWYAGIVVYVLGMSYLFVARAGVET